MDTNEIDKKLAVPPPYYEDGHEVDQEAARINRLKELLRKTSVSEIEYQPFVNICTALIFASMSGSVELIDIVKNAADESGSDPRFVLATAARERAETLMLVLAGGTADDNNNPLFRKEA